MFNSRITKVENLHEIRWVGIFISKWLFRGEHYFQLQKISDNQTLFVHGEIFTGFLVPIAAKKLKINIKKGFENMNNDLVKKLQK